MMVHRDFNYCGKRVIKLILAGAWSPTRELTLGDPDSLVSKEEACIQQKHSLARSSIFFWLVNTHVSFEKLIFRKNLAWDCNHLKFHFSFPSLGWKSHSYLVTYGTQSLVLSDALSKNARSLPLLGNNPWIWNASLKYSSLMSEWVSVCLSSGWCAIFDLPSPLPCSSTTTEMMAVNGRAICSEFARSIVVQKKRNP